MLRFAATHSLIKKFYDRQYANSLALLCQAVVPSVIFSSFESDDFIPSLTELSDCNNRFSEDILAGIKRQKHRQARNAVSNRIDQQLKPLWEAHCTKAVRSGVEISQLNDLFQVEGCSTDFKKHVDERTLKRWAKEAGIRFRPGRPKK